MSSEANKSHVSGQLAAVLFQVDEFKDDFSDLENLSLDELHKGHDEVKSLRVVVVQVSSELKSLCGDDYPNETEAKVQDALSVSKTLVHSLKKCNVTKEQEIQDAERAERKLKEDRCSEEEKGRQFDSMPC